MLENTVEKGIVPHGFYKLTVAFSSISLCSMAILM